MASPTSEQLGCLQGFEKTAFELCDRFSRHPRLQQAALTYQSTFGASWVDFSTRKLRYVQGTEHIRNLRPDRGVLLVANHRSFFDLYVTASTMFNETNWMKRIFFPVRSTFFYERPAGVAVNMVMSALAMYPPILRDASRKSFNQFAVDRMVELAREPGTLLGFHPEGTRSTGPNPYELLPAHPGVGQIVRLARPIVIPAFTLGLINDFPRQVKSNFDGTGVPVTLTFGPPVELGSLLDDEPKLRTFKRIADALRDAIAKLGEQDKAMRRRLGLPILEPVVASPGSPEASAG